MENQDNIALSLSYNITDTQLVEFLNTEIGDAFMVALHCDQSPAQECFVPVNYDQPAAEVNLDSAMELLINVRSRKLKPKTENRLNLPQKM
ncbi:hypothetical protein GDO81_011953 [Engystomops pustulosus]|uniref:Uncharacterized protein n=1 Tax=Engystomops pustulosus TaxID=76066 RepID=A0AAV7BIM6_ENGPU|nr:hypothetical protein GDO81_011953 [Engystomops pustulosus]